MIAKRITRFSAWSSQSAVMSTAAAIIALITSKEATFSRISPLSHSAAVGRNQKEVSPPLPPDLICEDNILNPT
ncbi:MAG: hypothetical protein V5B40_09100 [Candidatus Accumulibacter meliphilus]|uniref:hypothetical protein n=1 Tax=Candidatus Accumulibacter meliphilus TaxID=2211374 RepID=UPI002FC31613